MRVAQATRKVCCVFSQIEKQEGRAERERVLSGVERQSVCADAALVTHTRVRRLSAPGRD